MKKITLLVCLTLLFTLGYSQNFPGGGTPADTQNGNGTTAATCNTSDELNLTVLVSGIGVLGTANILDQVDIDITHTWSGDIEVTLIAPDGTTSAALTIGNGGGGDNYTGTQFRDDATTPITAGSAPFTGQFQPEEPLSTFNGVDADGTWTLNFCDSAAGDTGTFNSWSVTFAAAPACTPPSAISVSGITDSEATLNWTDSPSAITGVNIELGLAGFIPGNGESEQMWSEANGVQSVNATSLNDNTAYEFYIQSNCDTNGLSAWEGPISFTTPLSPIVPPYVNDFSTFPGTGWTEASTGDPTSGPSGTTSDWTSDDFGNDTGSPNGQSARINLWQAVDQEWLISPVFDLTTPGEYYLNLDVALTPFTGTAATNFGSDDEVQVLITSDGGSTWVNLLTYNLSNQPGTSREAAPEVDLSAYAGSNVQIAIWGSDGTTDDPEDNNFYVDNFQITSTSLSINDSQLSNFTFYPNPVTKTLNLDAQKNIEQVVILNILGQKVLAAMPNALSSEIDMSSLNVGTYFVKVYVENAIRTISIIKQ